MKTLRDMTAEIRAVNTEKGWRTVKNSWGDYVALLHSEISEMLEAYRDFRLADGTKPYDYMDSDTQVVRPAKPEGVGSEAADVLIRLLDMADVYGVPVFDLDNELADVAPVYPASGWPSSFGGEIGWLHRRASELYPTTGDEPTVEVKYALPIVLRALVAFCHRHAIDLLAEYERKIAYSWTRPYQHGGRTISDAEAPPAANAPGVAV